MKSLPRMSTHNQQWETNPGPFDHESSALLTRPHARDPTLSLLLKSVKVIE